MTGNAELSHGGLKWSSNSVTDSKTCIRAVTVTEYVFSMTKRWLNSTMLLHPNPILFNVLHINWIDFNLLILYVFCLAFVKKTDDSFRACFLLIKRGTWTAKACNKNKTCPCCFSLKKVKTQPTCYNCIKKWIRLKVKSLNAR